MSSTTVPVVSPDDDDITPPPPLPLPPSLLCVEYPGNVQNVPAMIETLGGLQTLAKVYEDPHRRLELRFRPADAFCKPACGERTSESGLLLRVRRLKRKRRKSAGKEEGPAEYRLDHEILGTIDTTFKFTSMCDFQYLPMTRSKDEGAYTSIYDSVYFPSDRLVDTSWLSTSSPPSSSSKIPSPSPLFLPPAVFSRMDVPQDYQYRREAAGEKAALQTPFNIIGRTRSRRSHHAIFVTYDVETVPDRAREVALSQLKVKFMEDKDQKVVTERFAGCPVWSKNALSAVTGIETKKLKFLLPSVAYYFTTGPWRNQWVRFGYDPRKHREAARYQTMDYRVRVQGGAKHKVKAKRSYANYVLPYKATNASRPKTSVIDRGSFKSIPANADSGAAAAASLVEEAEEAAETLKDIFMFRPTRIPPYRQMFYQFKDLELDRAREIVEEATAVTTDNDKEVTGCDEKYGWFKSGRDQELRDLMTKCINEQLTVQRDGEYGGGSVAAGTPASVAASIADEEEEEEEVEDEEDKDSATSDSEAE